MTRIARELVGGIRFCWKVKISDFGTSKTTVETSLRTAAGTRPYMAPEIMSFRTAPAYTSIVNIWSLGVILWQIVENHIIFMDQALFYNYCCGTRDLTTTRLSDNGTSANCVALLKRMLDPDPSLRPHADECMQDVWFGDVKNTPGLEEESTGEYFEFPYGDSYKIAMDEPSYDIAISMIQQPRRATGKMWLRCSCRYRELFDRLTCPKSSAIMSFAITVRYLSVM